MSSERPEIVGVIRNYTKLKKSGSEWVGCCPLHKEKTPSFYVSSINQAFFCHGCSAGGDVYTFIQRYHGCDFKESKRILGDPSKAEMFQPEEIPDKAAERKTFKPPAGTTLTKFSHGYFGEPVRVWEYRDSDGSLIHYVGRYERNGKKAYPQWTWDGSDWGMGHFNTPRPLYGLDKLAANPDAEIIIVEGEKAADAAGRLFPGFVCVTWSGGAAAIKKANWKPLMRRKLRCFWPDADEAGDISVPKMLNIFPDIKILRVAGKVDGWDAANAEVEGFTAETLLGLCDPQPMETQGDYPDGFSGGPPGSEETNNKPFTCLGYDGDTYYYLPYGKNQVIDIRAGQHSIGNLLQLANLSWWESRYPVSNGNRNLDLQAATSDLFQYCHSAGIYSPDRVRGRGAWLDNTINGHASKIVHLGEAVIVDGDISKPGMIGGRYIYEAKALLPVKKAAPASTEDAKKLVEICTGLTWETEQSGFLLAGWIVIAMVCGVLKWRPHIWITGPSSSGKTTVIKEIIGGMIGHLALTIDGTSTESSIRQFMGRDARPIIYDEAESEDANAMRRMQAVIELARVSSSGGFVTKGTTNHKGIGFNVRSCFCFSSINTAVSQYADETRISKLVLRRNEREDADDSYLKLKMKIDETITEEYAGAMFARSVECMDSLEANCRTFTAAAAQVFKDRRAADQIGTVLAGLYLCYNPKAITLDKAIAWIEAANWDSYTALAAASDEQRLLHTLCSRTIRVESFTGTKEVSIGEAILASHKGDHESFLAKDATRVLGQLGIKVQSGNILIANESAQLSSRLENTPWSKDWKRPLRMMKGASVSDKAHYFSAGLTQRATILPLSLIQDSGI